MPVGKTIPSAPTTGRALIENLLVKIPNHMKNSLRLVAVSLALIAGTAAFAQTSGSAPLSEQRPNEGPSPVINDDGSITLADGTLIQPNDDGTYTLPNGEVIDLSKHSPADDPGHQGGGKPPAGDPGRNGVGQSPAGDPGRNGGGKSPGGDPGRNGLPPGGR